MTAHFLLVNKPMCPGAEIPTFYQFQSNMVADEDFPSQFVSEGHAFEVMAATTQGFMFD